MEDFRLLLNELLKKYNLYKDDDLNKRLELFKKETSNLFLDINQKKKVMIWGVGEHTAFLYRYFKPCLELLNIIGLIDKNTKYHYTNKYDLTVFPPEYAKSAEVIIISSFNFRFDIKKEAQLLNPNCEIIDIYSKGKINIPFFTSSGKIKKQQLHKIYQNYLNATEDSADQCLMSLIRELLVIKDFYNALKYVEEYVLRGYKQSQMLQLFKLEFYEFIDNMKVQIKKIKNESIVFYMIDTLRFQEGHSNTKFLRQAFKKGISFENSYSYGSHTSMTLGNLFFPDEFEFDDYNLAALPTKKNKFIDKLIENNFKIYSMANYLEFSPEYKGHVKYYGTHTEENKWDIGPISEYLWELTNYLFTHQEDKYFIWVVSEDVHAPYFPLTEKPVSITSDIQQNHLNQKALYMESLQYLDEQLMFFNDLLPDELTKIYFSDHGRAFGENHNYAGVATWYDYNMKNFISINHPQYPAICIPNLFPSYHFLELILRVINEEDFSDLIQEQFVLGRRLTVVNPDLLQIETHDDPEKIKLAFWIVRGAYDEYVLYEDGREEYYIRPDEMTNLIEDTKYHKRICLFKKFLSEKVGQQHYYGIDLF